MPEAICVDCGRSTHYRNTRGSRIADLRCACGGSLRGKSAGQPKEVSDKPFRLRLVNPDGVVYRTMYFALERRLAEYAEDWCRYRVVKIERRDPETHKWVAFDLAAVPA